MKFRLCYRPSRPSIRDEEGNVAKNRMLEASDMSPLKENTGDVPESNFGPGIKMLLGCCNPFAWPRACCSGVKFLSNPSWIALAEACGCSDVEERPLRLSPSHKDCVDHGLKNLFDIMGASCGFFCTGSIGVFNFLFAGDQHRRRGCRSFSDDYAHLYQCVFLPCRLLVHNR